MYDIRIRKHMTKSLINIIKKNMIGKKESLKFFKNTKPRLIILCFMYILLGIISVITPILTANLLSGLINQNMYMVFSYAVGVAVIFIFQEKFVIRLLNILQLQIIF